jgi:protein gp37
MSLDKRIQKNQESIKNLHQLLIDICKKPQDFSFEHYSETLKSQGGIAKIHDEERKIQASSINTLKRISKEIFENGFEELDRIRIMAYESLLEYKENGDKSNKITKIGLNKRVEALEDKISKLQQAHLLSMNTLVENLNAFKNILNNKSPEAIKFLSQESIDRLQSLALCSPLFLEVKDNSNIIQFNKVEK